MLFYTLTELFKYNVSATVDADCRSIEMQKGKMLCSAMMTEQAQSIKDFFYRKRFRSSGSRQSWSSSKCTRRTRLKLSHFDWTSLVNSRLIIKQYEFTLIRIKSGFFFWVLGKIANCVCSTIILQNRSMFSLFWLSFLVLFWLHCWRCLKIANFLSLFHKIFSQMKSKYTIPSPSCAWVLSAVK